MNPVATYINFMILFSGFLLFVGLIMMVAWIALVEAYTAYFRWRCRRDPVYFAKHVLKLPVSQWQATHLRAPRGRVIFKHYSR